MTWLLAVLLGLLVSLETGFVMSKGWNWILVPHFGLPPMSVVAACAIGTLWMMLKGNGGPSPTDNDLDKMIHALVIKGLIYCPFILGWFYLLSRIA